MRKGIVLSIATATILLGVAVGAWAQSSGARTDVRVHPGAAALVISPAPSHADLARAVSQEHAAAVHTYVATVDDTDTHTERVHSK